MVMHPPTNPKVCGLNLGAYLHVRQQDNLNNDELAWHIKVIHRQVSKLDHIVTIQHVAINSNKAVVL